MSPRFKDSVRKVCCLPYEPCCGRHLTGELSIRDGLLETGYLDLLPKLYRQIIVPDSVYRELLAAGVGSIVTEWASALPSWVSVRQPSVILPTSRHLQWQSQC